MTDTSAADAYEKFLVPNIFGPWAKMVLDDYGPKPGQDVLDVACGTGIATRLAAIAAGAKGHVTGADLDVAMLEVARSAAAPRRGAPIEWRFADATALPFSDSSFDLVQCFEGLQFFPDRAKAVAEFRRVLRKGGRVVGTVWGPLADNPGYQALADGLVKFVSPDAGRLPPFSLTEPAAIHALLAGAGLQQIRIEAKRLSRPVPSAVAFIDWVSSGAPTTRHRLALLPDDKRGEFLTFVTHRLERFRSGDALDMPYMRHVFEAVAV